MRIALTTAEHLPNGSEDDQVLIAALQQQGMEPVSVIWDQPADWQKFDCIVLRSIWDYHLKYERFLRWLDELDESGVPVHNNPELVRWNADKSYMLELERRGVRITPTRLIEPGDAQTLAGIQAETGWGRMVVKPTVASTGYETWVTAEQITSDAETQFSAQKSRMPLLVQEFIAGVYAGEQSLVFLAGEYSHAVLKRSAGEEFRVHIEHGGTVERFTPDPALVQWAQSVVDVVEQPWTYARVDLVLKDDAPVLMELELLDPELFFKYEPAAAPRMIAALSPTHAR